MLTHEEIYKNLQVFKATLITERLIGPSYMEIIVKQDGEGEPRSIDSAMAIGLQFLGWQALLLPNRLEPDVQIEEEKLFSLGESFDTTFWYVDEIKELFAEKADKEQWQAGYDKAKKIQEGIKKRFSEILTEKICRDEVLQYFQEVGEIFEILVLIYERQMKKFNLPKKEESLKSLN